MKKIRSCQESKWDLENFLPSPNQTHLLSISLTTKGLWGKGTRPEFEIVSQHRSNLIKFEKVQSAERFMCLSIIGKFNLMLF